MNLRHILLVAFWLACAVNIGGQTPKKTAVKDWAEQWKMATEQLLGIAETMPADKYEYQ